MALPTRNPALLSEPASISEAARSPLSPENVGRKALEGLWYINDGIPPYENASQLNSIQLVQLILSW